MKVNAENLTGAALDWAVAKCEGMLAFGYRTDGERFAINNSDGEIEAFMPSSFWYEGGPIIEREGIAVYPDSAPDMPEIKWSADAEDALCWGGPTPLVAAMRAYVVSKLGSEVEIPEELK